MRKKNDKENEMIVKNQRMKEKNNKRRIRKEKERYEHNELTINVKTVPS